MTKPHASTPFGLPVKPHIRPKRHPHVIRGQQRTACPRFDSPDSNSSLEPVDVVLISRGVFARELMFLGYEAQLLVSLTMDGHQPGRAGWCFDDALMMPWTGIGLIVRARFVYLAWERAERTPRKPMCVWYHLLRCCWSTAWNKCVSKWSRKSMSFFPKLLPRPLYCPLP